MASMSGSTLLTLVLALSLTVSQSSAQLQFQFYSRRCPNAENIIRSEVQKAVRSNPGLAAGLVRLHFHDCFVRGCDASVLIDSKNGNTAEKDSPVNNPSLRGFEVIDKAKARLESACRGVVSCADILAFAARDSVSASGGSFYGVPAGRRDGSVSLASDAFSNLPGPLFNLNQLNQNFASKGLSQSDMVILSGAHSIGRSHCSAFSTRLYGFGAGRQDPTMAATFAATLKRQCPAGNTRNVVPMDAPSPFTLDTSYYSDLTRNQGLLASDQTLMSTPGTAAQVRQFAANPALFKSNFAAAMVKMGNIGVLTGNSGKIRSNCRVV